MNEYLNPFRINTTTNDGVVVLKGSVDDPIEKDLAEALAKSVDGVRQVTNELTIRRPDQPDEFMTNNEVRKHVEDATVRAAVRRQLAYNSGLNTSDLGVEVSDLKVRLYGSVPTEAEREEAGEIAEDTRGVATVQNDLVVEEPGKHAQTAENGSSVSNDVDSLGHDVRRMVSDVGDALSDEWVEKHIETQIALNRNVSMRGLDVDVKDGTATLTGTVISKEQRDLAGAIARHTRGVRNVDNEIVVTDIRTK